MTAQLPPDALIRSALAWADADPDPATRAELEDAVRRCDRAALSAAMGNPLTFGTAGLRGIVGPGPSRMNSAVIRRTAYGLVCWLRRRFPDSDARPVVVGYDARPTSRSFAEQVVGVLCAARVAVRFFERPAATPLVAFAHLQYGATASVVITASHNPPEYNGFKLYVENGVQIVPPGDRELEEQIAGAPAALNVPIQLDAMRTRGLGVEPVDEGIAQRYRSEIVTTLSRSPRPPHELSIVTTALHGVGGETLREVLHLAGFDAVTPVAAQEAPDGRFPTVAFPNPELPGALERGVVLARDQRADLLVALDPDADRLAVAVPDAVGEWSALSGNQVGVLLADYLLDRVPVRPTPLVLTTIVSTPMLRALAEARGARVEETLTGFKWLWNAALSLEERESVRFAFAFEEAIGYSVTRLVRDKDGISAALAVCEMTAEYRRRGLSLRERLVELYRRYGLWVSHQQTIAFSTEASRDPLDALLRDPPQQLGARRVTGVVDYRRDAHRRQVWLGAADVCVLHLAGGGRAVVRPSGTEPKLKVYVDLSESLGEAEAYAPRRRALDAEATQIAEELAAGLL